MPGAFPRYGPKNRTARNPEDPTLCSMTYRGISWREIWFVGSMNMAVMGIFTGRTASVDCIPWARSLCGSIRCLTICAALNMLWLSMVHSSKACNGTRVEVFRVTLLILMATDSLPGVGESRITNHTFEAPKNLDKFLGGYRILGGGQLSAASLHWSRLQR